MNRVQLLMQGLGVNEVQASLYDELIKDIPDNKLKDFLVFRLRFVEQYKSSEVATKEALFEYQKGLIMQQLQKGIDVFNNVYEVQQFIETYFKGQEIGNGLANYYDFVVISLDRDLHLLNTYTTPYTKLNSEEKQDVYNYLFENQNKIGIVKFFKEANNLLIHKDVEQITNDINNKINKNIPKNT